MAAPELVASDMTLGMEVAKALWKDPVLTPTAAMWLYDEDAEEWRFLVATEDTRRRGPQAAYLRIRNLLKNANLLERIPLRRVVVADPSSPLLTTVGGVIKTPGDELAGLSFYNCTFKGLAVAGMHIYHLNDESAQLAAKNEESDKTDHAATSGR